MKNIDEKAYERELCLVENNNQGGKGFERYQAPTPTSLRSTHAIHRGIEFFKIASILDGWH